MSFKFTADMFKSIGLLQQVLGGTASITCTDAAAKANALLEAHLAKCPSAYGRQVHGRWIMDGPRGATHKCVLMNIEPIEKPKCEHRRFRTIVFQDSPELPVRAKCSDCEATLTATWSEAEGGL